MTHIFVTEGFHSQLQFEEIGPELFTKKERLQMSCLTMSIAAQIRGLFDR